MIAGIDMMRLAAYPGAKVAEEIERRSADILDGHVATEGRIIFVPLQDIAEIADTGCGERLDRTGGDGVDADIVSAKLHREIAHRGLKPRFGDAHHIIMRDNPLRPVIGKRDNAAAV